MTRLSQAATAVTADRFVDAGAAASALVPGSDFMPENLAAVRREARGPDVEVV